MKLSSEQSFKHAVVVLLATIALSLTGESAQWERRSQKEDPLSVTGIQTHFDHHYRRYGRLLRETLLRGRPTPESIVRSSYLRDSIRDEFLRVTAEKMGQWDDNQRIAYLANVRNLLVLSKLGRGLTDSTEIVIASRTITLQTLDMELSKKIERDPRLAITLFSSIPFGPAWSTDPVKAENMDNTLTELWRDYINRPEVLTMNATQKRTAVNRWLGDFSDKLSANWAGSSRFADADPEIAPLLAFLWAVADEAMRTRLESTDQWTLVRPPGNPMPLTAPVAVPSQLYGDGTLPTSPGQ